MPTGPLQILFKIDSSAAEGDVVSSLNHIGKLKGIFNARSVVDADADPVLKRLFVAEVDPTVDTQELLESITGTAHVKFAKFLPIKRLPPPERR